MTKEEFLNQHMDEIQKTLWLLEVDAIIMSDALKKNRDPKFEEEIKKRLNEIWQKVNGMEFRRKLIIKVINGTVEVDNPTPPDKPTHTVQE